MPHDETDLLIAALKRIEAERIEEERKREHNRLVRKAEAIWRKRRSIEALMRPGR